VAAAGEVAPKPGRELLVGTNLESRGVVKSTKKLNDRGDVFCQDKKKISACRGEGSAAGLQLGVRFLPAGLLAMLRTALALQCVSKARDWTSHVVR
jgi:hypothetical protein